jgi:hypothetical protein
MPLNKSGTKEALKENISEMIASSKQSGAQMGRARKKLGKDKVRQMAVAAAFAIKDKRRK